MSTEHAHQRLRTALLAAPARGELDIAGVGLVVATPLLPADVDSDLEAVLASRDRLRRWSRSPWPEDDFGRDDDLVDLERHDREHRSGEALTYRLAVADGSTVGCLYAMPAAAAWRTRELLPPPPGTTAAPQPDDLVVRGWLRSPLDERPLVGATATWLDRSFPRLRWWWQCPADLDAQLDGCDDAMLTTRWRLGAWLFCTAG